MSEEKEIMNEQGEQDAEKVTDKPEEESAVVSDEAHEKPARRRSSLLSSSTSNHSSAFNEDDAEAATISFSEHMSGLVESLVDPSTPVASKLQTSRMLQPFIQQLDAYVEIDDSESTDDSSPGEGPTTFAQIPPFAWNPQYRKAYTVCMWLRPVVVMEQAEIASSSSPVVMEKRQKLLYRFSTAEDDPSGVGICVTLGDTWTLVKEHTQDEVVREGTKDSTSSQSQSASQLLETTITAFCLPYPSQQSSNFIHLPLLLPANSWSLVCCTHVFPYLKRPQWTICVNGRIQGTGELSYPVLEGSQKYMTHNALLQNVCYGGVRDYDAVSTKQDSPTQKRHDQMTASELNAPKPFVTRPLKLQVASLAMHPDAIAPVLQQLLYDAGPSLSLQQYGRIVTHLPPVSNDTKGTSLDGGPSVGVPLSSHEYALTLQRMGSSSTSSGGNSNTSGSLWFGATHAKVFSTRIVLPLRAMPGEFQDTPKVGLVQPGVPGNHHSAATSNSSSEMALHFFGKNTHVVHALSEYLLKCNDLRLDTHLHETSLLFSLHWMDQNFLSSLVMPFFLAQIPSGYGLDLQQVLYERSLQHLYQLYSNEGEWAATLILLLRDAIQYQGARVHEYVLQAGLLHVLNTNLRRTLVRAQQLQVYQCDTYEAFRKRLDGGEAESPYANAVCPKKIPLRVVEACASLIRSCCGGTSSTLASSPTNNVVRRSSDLAMAAVFGMALDLDLWGQNPVGAERVIGTVASLYRSEGDLLRVQIPVQSFLDALRVRFDKLSPELEPLADHFATLLQAMLTSSLSNRRQIAPGEHDVIACLGALSDCALGTVGAHVVLTALNNLHQNVELAQRLARNLTMGQYHDVVAPMLLSRTVFSGERMMMSSGVPDEPFYLWQYHWRLALALFAWTTSLCGPEGEIAARSTGSLLFASALAGSLDGCLVQDIDRDKNSISSLFLPPPSMAFANSSGNRGGRPENSPRSYTDLLSSRLQVMMPLLPGLVISLVSHPADVNKETQPDKLDSCALDVLAELLSAVSSSFQRVFGGIAHAAMSQVRRTHMKGRNTAMHSTVVKAAREYASHLLMVSVLLESHVQVRELAVEDNIVVFKAPQPRSSRPRADSDKSWVEVSSHQPGSDDSLLDSSSYFASNKEFKEDLSLTKLSSCLKVVTRTLTDLILNAMKLGGGEASTVVWRGVVSTLKDSIFHGTLIRPKDGEAMQTDQGSDTLQDKKSQDREKRDRVAHDVLCRLAAIVLTKAQKRDYDWEMWSTDLCAAMSRLCDLVEEKELLQRPMGRTGEKSTNAQYSRDQTLLLSALVDVMSYGREITGWCQLVLPTPPAADLDMEGAIQGTPGVGQDESAAVEDEPLVGSPAAGGGFTTPPRTPIPKSGHEGFVPPESPAAASKAMLPILQPVLRTVLSSVGNVASAVEIVVPEEPKAGSKAQSDTSEDESKVTFARVPLLQHICSELRQTLMAAIVGLSFPNARDTALNALATLRRASNYYNNAQDEKAIEICYALFAAVVEEIRARYEGERRLREKALFDAYEDDEQNGSPSRKVDRSEAESSREVERLILGGDLIPSSSVSDAVQHDAVEEITFSNDTERLQIDSPGRVRRKVGSEDFVMFHETYGEKGDISSGQKRPSDTSKMGYNQYQGLGSTLEECKILMNSESGDGSPKQPGAKTELLLSLLTPYLDTWDENSARDAAESELVELFDASFGIGDSNRDDSLQSQSSDLSSTPRLLMGGSETAADAMTTFIEMASVEKSRLQEMVSMYLPSHRRSLRAYAERFCWTRYMELIKEGKEDSMEILWERGISDGNRDIRSRIITVPCNPQFKRYIPSYLDHGAPTKGEEDEVTPESLQASSSTLDDGSRRGSKLNAGSRRASTADEIDFGELTKHLLEAGNIEIVDITKKKQVEGEDLPEIMDPDSMALLDDSDDDYFGDGSLGFPSRDDEQESGNESTSSASDGDDISADLKKAEAPSKTETSSALEEEEEFTKKIDKSDISSLHHNVASSPFAHPPDNSSSMLNTIHSSQAGLIEDYFENCLHVKAEGSRKCTIFLSATHLILEYDAESQGLYEGEMLAVQEEADRQRVLEEMGGHDDSNGKGEDIQDQLERQHRDIASTRPRSVRLNLSELSHVYLRRYRLRDSALEMFFIPSGGSSYGGFGLYSAETSLFLDFGAGYEGNVRRDDAANSIMRRAPPQAVKQWPDRSRQFLHEQLSRLTIGWVDGRITNFDYLLHLNMLAGRSYNDLCQYPVMPWVLSDYKSEDIPDLSDPSNFRDLSKPIGALNPDRLKEFIERFETFADPTIPPFMYGSHYSTNAGVVLHFLVRLHPFAGLHRQLQGGYFDVADRLFSSVPRTWDMCTGSSAAEVKELTPEWYCNPAFLKNTNNFKLGTSQDGELLGDVTLPPWAKGSPEKFVEVMRNALESDICSEMLPDWIDLIFGRKQQGPEAIKAHNVFFYLTYYGSVDVASIEDEALRVATELQIAHFGQCPMQLFSRSHVRRVQRMRNFRKLSFYQMLSAYTQGAGPQGGEEKEDSEAVVEKEINKDGSQRLFGAPMFLPFFSAPTSHWVHLDAPPPGPHAALIAIRLAGTDRVLAVDALGIFHSFRWAWKPEASSLEDEMLHPFSDSVGPIDKGCFVAQRELPRFRIVPRLPYVPTKRSGEMIAPPPAVAMSKTLFSGRSVLLVLSDGDGCGALSMQLVDPAKATVKGETIVPAVHSSRITCISMDPIGTAAGHGGVGGELAVVGSADGGATIWRFMSSHYLPLRPRVRLGGHGGAKVQAVALSSSIHICATLSATRCCIFSVGNGAMIRSFPPPQDTLNFPVSDDVHTHTLFADTPALALSVQGFVVTVCKTTVESKSKPSLNRVIITLHLFSLEGVSLGSKALESWRGVPHKITCTPDGTAISVCHGRGVTIHRLSAITPLEYIDEWQITETEELDDNIPAAWDVDFGPSLLRPVVAAAACSSGSLRLHALPGITPWSDRHRKSTMGAAVGQALAKPAKRLKSAVGKGLGFGSKFVGVGKEIGREVQTDVKERGVGGFLAGTIFSRKPSNK